MPWTPRGWVDEKGSVWADPSKEPSLQIPPVLGGPPQSPVGPSAPRGIPPVTSNTPGGSSDQTPGYRPTDEQSKVPGAGGGDPLTEILREYLKQTAIERAQLADPEYQRGLSDIQVDAYRRMADVAQQAAMEKSRERSRREIELQNMKSWADITRAQIDKEARLAESLARTAYIAHTPNANILSALAPTVQQATAAYKQPQSVFPS